MKLLHCMSNERRVFMLKQKHSIFKSLIACLLMIAMIVSFPMAPKASAATDVVININSNNQTIRGFGGMNHVAWIGDLTAGQRDTAFGNGNNQLGFSILRIYVDENPNNWYRELDTAKRAIALGAIVFASPWNPPSSMVETFTRNGKSAKRLRYDKYAAYAQHLNDFVTYMKNNGVNLYAISVQNEPDYAEEWTWWTPTEILNFMKYNAGSINCRVIAPESFQYLKNISDPILNDPQALANMDILGAHLYGTPYSNFAYPLFQQKGAGKDLWMTEVYHPNSTANSADSWPEALEVGYHMHNALVEGNFQAYVWWYIRRNYGPMKEDGTISKRGYNMAHFSKFVRPGYVRIDATKNPDTNVYVSAYKGDNKVVIVAINRSTTSGSQNFVLNNGNVTKVERYRTSSSENMVKTADMEVANNSFWAHLPAQSITTFVATLSGSNSGNTGTVYEAETNTTFVNSVAESINTGFSGTGYANFNSYTGASVQWNNIYCATSGTKNVKFTYALETGTRNLDVYVNDVKVASNLAFNGTGAWTTWVDMSIQVQMNTGNNTLRLVTTGTEGPNIDKITVSLP